MSIKFVNDPETGKVGYRVSVWIGRNQFGKAKIKTRFIRGTREQAQAVENQLKIARENARNAKSEAQLIMRYRELTYDLPQIKLETAFDKAMQKPHRLSEKKIPVRRAYWLDFVAWMQRNYPLIRYIHNVLPAHAENYIAFLRKHGTFIEYERTGEKNLLSADTLNFMHGIMKQVFNLLKNESCMNYNPFGDIPKLTADHAERDAFTPEQLKVIFDKADPFIKPLFFIGLFTGLSEGDVCTLRKDEVHFDVHHIYRKRRKTGKLSSIPMLPVLEDYLSGLIDDPANTSEYVLPEHARLYLIDRSITSKRIKKFLELDCMFDTVEKIKNRTRAHSKLDFHSLRHTFCSFACAAGIPQNVVQSIAGHMSPKMTELYARHVQEAERMHWISLLGEKINSIPFSGHAVQCSASASLLPAPIEPERSELIEKVKSLPMPIIRKILAGIS